MRVGLTGGIGAGKSAVARLFAAWGAVVIDADLLARDVVAPGTPALAEIASRWPAVVAEGSLDRAALSRIIFADRAQRDALGAIVHPRVRERAAAAERAAPPAALVVHVVPLLFEGDFWTTCERTVVVIAPRAQRLARVAARDGLTPAAIEARMATQIEPARAAERATYVIENAGDLTALERAAREVYDALRRDAAG